LLCLLTRDEPNERTRETAGRSAARSRVTPSGAIEDVRPCGPSSPLRRACLCCSRIETREIRLVRASDVARGLRDARNEAPRTPFARGAKAFGPTTRHADA